MRPPSHIFVVFCSSDTISHFPTKSANQGHILAHPTVQPFHKQWAGRLRLVTARMQTDRYQNDVRVTASKASLTEPLDFTTRNTSDSIAHIHPTKNKG